MVEPSELRDLPPDQFGVVVASVVEAAWGGDVDVSPPSPGGSVDAVIRGDDGDRLLHARQGDRIDAEAVADVSRLALERGFDAVTLVGTGPVTAEGHDAAQEADVDLLDGESFSAMVEDAGGEWPPTGRPPVAALVSQLAGHWPERLREVAVELATTIEGADEFDRELTRGSERADVDFRRPAGGRVVARMRFLRTSLVVYVRRDDALASVVRLTAHRETQPSVRELRAEVETALRGVLGE